MLVTAGVESIESLLKGASLPPLDDAEIPSIMHDSRYLQSASLVLSAASRLIAAVQTPCSALYVAATGMHQSAMLNVVIEANITEALKEAGPQGLHIRDLAEKVNMEPDKLARCLRYLCVFHIYREVSPNVFANNRISAALDTGLPFDRVKDRGPHRYDDASGAAAHLGLITGDFIKAAAILPDILLDPKKSAEMSPATPPATQAFDFDGCYFDWLEQPGNEKHFSRFGAAMRNLDELTHPGLALNGFDWDALPKDTLIVDVGGGVGGTTLTLAKNLPDLRFIVQDRPPVISDGEKFWRKELPEALDSKSVQLQVQNFFKPQTVKGAAVYMLRYIIHDWPDAEARRILRHLRESASPSTKLLLFDQIVPYTCPVEDALESCIPGSPRDRLPKALQGNPGSTAGLIFLLDMLMMSMSGSQERTIGEWNDLIESSGWRIERIKHGSISSIICTPT